MPVVRVGAAVAASARCSRSSPGIGRTVLAMARERRPAARASTPSTRGTVPHRAELASPRWSSLLVLVTDLRGAIGFSLVRRAAVLRDRERLGVHAGRRPSAVAARAATYRSRRLRDARRDAAGCVGRRRHRDVRNRPGGPGCRRPPPRRHRLKRSQPRSARPEVRPPGRTRAGGASSTSSPGRRASGAGAGRGAESSRHLTGRS